MTHTAHDHANTDRVDPGSEPADKYEHADKYNDPRVRITARGLVLGACVILLGILGSAFSIWARRTKLEKSTAFWGEEVIAALQLSEEVELVPKLGTEPKAEAVRLSGMPGLGHLRHTLLDDRSYQWESMREQPMSEFVASEQCMMLRLSDPSVERFPEARIVIALESGWVGLDQGVQRVRLSERFRKAVPAFLTRVANYEPLRAEVRERQKQAESPE